MSNVPSSSVLSRPYQSLVDPVLSAIYAIFAERFADDPDTQVHDGPWTSQSSALNAVAIGWSGFPKRTAYPSSAMNEAEGSPDVEVEVEMMGMGPSIYETMTIHLASISRKGVAKTGNITEARHTAYANVNRAGGVLTQPPWLNNLVPGVDKVWVGNQHQLHQVQDNQGALAIVTFGIQVSGWAQQ